MDAEVKTEETQCPMFEEGDAVEFRYPDVNTRGAYVWRKGTVMELSVASDDQVWVLVKDWDAEIWETGEVNLLPHEIRPWTPDVELEDAAASGPEFAPKDDKVVHPAHYTQFEIEPIEFIMRNKLPFEIGNVVKYVCRAGAKKYDDLSVEDSELRDLNKAKRYIDMRINLLTGAEKL